MLRVLDLMQSATLRVLLTAAMAAGAGAAAAAQQQTSSSEPPPPVHGTSTSTTARTSSASVPSSSSTKPASVVTDDSALRIEGEKRFRTNCGRCHMAPHKFPPRTMATAVRHMRIRAMITDEDMRLILRYLIQ
jgi:mono/diheme cytochrome c family protein